MNRARFWFALVGVFCLGLAGGVLLEDPDAVQLLGKHSKWGSDGARTPGFPGEVLQEFEERFRSYSGKEREVVERHVAEALDGLDGTGGEYEVAAALNAYIYRQVTRVDGSTGNSAVELLQRREAVCGGMVMMLAEMLYSKGIRSRYAFLVGGNVAHSMVEVSFSNGERGLFDPYHGVAYFDDKLEPVSLFEIHEYLARDERPILFVRRKETMPWEDGYFAGAYSRHDEGGRDDYEFEELFLEARAAGVANSGYQTMIQIHLQPGDLVGLSHWQPEQGGAPWNVLATWQQQSGEYLSWAYMLGQMGLGYIVGHAYELEGLVAGQRFVLRLYVANAYDLPGDAVVAPAVTIQPVAPFGRPHVATLENRGFSGAPYQPQLVEVPFTATSSRMVMTGHATGSFVLQGIELERAGNGEGG